MIGESWNWDTETETINVTGLAEAADYYVYVYAYDSDVQYNLSIDVLYGAAAAGAADAFADLVTNSTIALSDANFITQTGNTDLGDDSLLTYTLSTDLLTTSEVDMYSFSLLAGERVVLDLDDDVTSVDNIADSMLWIYDSTGTLVSSNDDNDPTFGGGGSSYWSDAYLEFTASEAGTYYAAVSGYYNDPLDSADASSYTGDYVINISLDDTYAIASNADALLGAQDITSYFTTSTNDDLTDDTLATATLTNQILDGYTAVNFYEFFVAAGSQVILDIDYGVDDWGYDLDSMLWLYDAAGTQVAYNDDNDPLLGGLGSNEYNWGESYLTYTNSTGSDATYVAAVSAYYNDPMDFSDSSYYVYGDYTLHVSLGDSSVDTGVIVADYNDTIAEADSIISDFADVSGATNYADFGDSLLPSVTINADLSSDTDVDFYEVYLGNNEQMIFDIDYGLNASGWTMDTMLTLYDANGYEVAFNDDNDPLLGGAGTDSWGESYLTYTNFDAAQYFYVAVTGYGNDPLYTADSAYDSGTYTLNVSHAATLDAYDTAVDLAGNYFSTAYDFNSTNSGAALAVGTTYTVDEWMDWDFDWQDMFSFTLDTETAISLDVTSATGIDWAGNASVDMYFDIYDADWNWYDWGNIYEYDDGNDYAYSEGYSANAVLEAGTYYVSNYAYSYDTDYTMSITTSTPAVDLGGEYFEVAYQINDADGDGASLVAGTLYTVNETLDYNADDWEDMFSFSIAADSDLSITLDALSSDDGNAYASFDIWDENWNWFNWSSIDTLDPSTLDVSLSAGTYYIDVIGWNDNLNYDLKVTANTLTGTIAGSGDSANTVGLGDGWSDGNDTVTEADSNFTQNPLNFGFSFNPDLADDTLPTATINAALETNTDVDYYRVDLTAGQELVLDIDYGLMTDDSALDTMIWLYDASGNFLAENDWADPTLGGGGSDSWLDAYLTYTNDTGVDASYYVAISGYYNDPDNMSDESYFQTGDYTLNISKSIDGTENFTGLTFASDDNDSWNLATTLGAAGSDFVLSTDNADWAADLADSALPTAHIVATLGSDTDVDFYSISLSAGDDVILDVDHGENNFGYSLDSMLWVYTENGGTLTLVESNDDSGEQYGGDGSISRSEAFLAFTAAETDTYYVAVTGYYNDPTYLLDSSYGETGSYELNVSVDDGSVVKSSAGNDTMETAELLGLGGVAVFTTPPTFNGAAPVDATIADATLPTAKITSADMDNEDVDFYYFSVAAGQEIIVDIDNGLTTDGEFLDTMVWLYDADGNFLVENDWSDPTLGGTGSWYDTDANGNYISHDSTDTTGATESWSDAYLTYTPTVAGDYYVAVSGYYNDPFNSYDSAWNSVGTYDMNISLGDVADGIDYTSGATTDPGDTFDTASVLEVASGTALAAGNSVTVDEWVGWDDYSDMFSFTLADAQSDVSVLLDGLSGDADITVWDTDWNYYGSSWNGGTTAEQLDMTLDAGTYYAEVVNYDTSVDYTITVDVAAFDINAVTENSDDTWDGATVLVDTVGVGGTVDAGSDWIDTYTFSITSANAVASIGMLSMIDGVASTGTLLEANLAIFDANGWWVDGYWNWSDDGIVVDAELAEGDYYVEVSAWGDDVEYGLALNVGTAASDPAGEDFETALDVGIMTADATTQLSAADGSTGQAVMPLTILGGTPSIIPRFLMVTSQTKL
jgi:hypothetical protein